MKKPQSGIYEDKHTQLHVENGVEVTLFIIYLFYFIYFANNCTTVEYLKTLGLVLVSVFSENKARPQYKVFQPNTFL